nr:immunoglobulin light chain junction region [Macaca mulatta]MOV95301.1 immunoglobulin light chain junction region [Macaca mulatta]MOV96064.1 immunoglobulin light chain junction region [Macaca mulatta]MOV96204.1 immunoglobulin light chain junction region [Macaca mulatta]MOV96739.1 immunoglobulin light chain junction region [Macaca mulatta]
DYYCCSYTSTTTFIF